jgi:hypothetical protein
VSTESNAFTPEFLRRFEEVEDEPPTAGEAEVAGPVRVRRLPDRRFGVFLAGRERPVLAFRERSRALLAAGMLPCTGREAAYVLGKDAGPDGYPLLAGFDASGRPDVAGHMEHFDEKLAGALQAGDGVVRSPESLAYLMAAAGKAALERAGALLDRITAELAEEPE